VVGHDRTCVMTADASSTHEWPAKGAADAGTARFRETLPWSYRTIARLSTSGGIAMGRRLERLDLDNSQSDRWNVVSCFAMFL